MLRYYDEIGLLKPIHTDKFTDYRYYSAEQLPHLNRILALKDLGLSLDQIQRMLSAKVSTDEIQGMLLLKKAEIEQQLQEELRRIRNIESRLQFIRNVEANKPLDVVLKRIPAQPVLSLRTVFASTEAAMAVFGQIIAALPKTGAYSWFFGVWHSDSLDEGDIDVELARGVLRRLTQEEMNHYREPFRDPPSRKPIWRWPNESPIAGQPADVTDAVSSYNHWLQQSALPKILLNATPGELITAAQVEWCVRSLTNLKTVHVGEGRHYLQEDHPHRIGTELTNWYQMLKR